ncbi:MAG TPA: hypothetical protein VF286_06860, partial [Acidiphilium sp.]
MASGHNKRFLEDQIKYMKEVVIIPNDGLFDSRTPQELMLTTPTGTVNPVLQSHARIFLDLVPIDGSWFSSSAKMVRADFSTTPTGNSDSPIEGCYVPYIFEGTVNQDPTKMGCCTLPASGIPKFAFTGPMNGCSLILCRDGTGNMVAVHYPNSAGSTQGYPHLATL